MARADYGGDGRATTREGMLVYWCDRFGVHPCGEDVPIPFEAAWGQASCSPEFVRDTAFLLAKVHANNWQIGFKETMRVLDNLNLLGMTPLGRAQGPGPTRGGDDAA